MSNILTTTPIEIIEQALRVFQGHANCEIDNEVMNKPGYQEAILELSKLHEIVETHPPEIAKLMLNEKQVPKDITELLISQSHKSTNSTKCQFSYAWRLDQSVPNVQAILLNVTDKNTDKVKTMRMDLSTFHKLRYNVSLLCKEHTILERKVCK